MRLNSKELDALADLVLGEDDSKAVQALAILIEAYKRLLAVSEACPHCLAKTKSNAPRF